MNKYTFKVYEKSKYHEGEVEHSTQAKNMDEAVENFYKHMKNFGYTKEDIRKELNAS